MLAGRREPGLQRRCPGRRRLSGCGGPPTGLLQWGTDAPAGRLHPIPIAAGGFVYIAAADLIPELQHDRTGRALLAQVTLIALGMGIMGLLAAVE